MAWPTRSWRVCQRPSFSELSDLYPLTVVQDRPQIWKPMVLDPDELTLSGRFDFVSIGRLKAGVSVRQAASELDAIQRDFAGRMPKAGGPYVRSHVIPLQDRIVGRARTGLQLLLVAVSIVLFIGCVNITNLLLARLSSRTARAGRKVRDRGQPLAADAPDDLESLTVSAVGGAACWSRISGTIDLDARTR